MTGRRGPSFVVGALATLALAALVATRHYVSYWRNSETLFRRAIAVTENNFVAYNNLGTTLQEQGRLPEAIACYRKALLAFDRLAEAHYNMANCYRLLKQPREAIAEFKADLKLDPKNAGAHYFLGNALLAEGDAAGAAEHYRAGLALAPDHPGLHYQLALVLLGRGDIEGGYRQYREAIRLKPDWVEALNNLAWSLATQPDARFRDGQEALRLAARAVALTHTNDANALDTLAGALAEAGRYSEAAQAAQTAAGLVHASGRQVDPAMPSGPFREPRAPGAKPADRP